MCVYEERSSQSEEEKEEDKELWSNNTGISSFLALKMEFWKRIEILKSLNVIDKIEIGVMFVMVFGSESNP